MGDKVPTGEKGGGSAKTNPEAEKWKNLGNEKEKAKDEKAEVLKRTGQELGKTALDAVDAPETAFFYDYSESESSNENADFQPPTIYKPNEVIPYEEKKNEVIPYEEKQNEVVPVEDKENEVKPVEEKPERKPLTAINAHRNKDVMERAHELAEERLNKELQAAKGIKGIFLNTVKGSLLRTYFITKGEKQALEDIRNKQRDHNTRNNQRDNAPDDEWQSLSDSTIDRLTRAARDKDKFGNMIHEDEEMFKENKEATSLAKNLISDYATGKIDEKTFNQKIDDVRKMLKEDSGINGENMAEDNFFELANEAKARFEHEEAIEDIMEGFMVVNADVRTGAKSEIHRNAVEKIIHKTIEMKNKIPGLNLIPGEAIALGVSIGTIYAQGKARTAAAVFGAGVGGIAVAAGIAAAKESEHVAQDRNQRLREMAKNLGNAGETAYDQEIDKSMYKMYKANDLTESISKAMESGNYDEVMNSVLQAEAIISRTDGGKIDHIAYSSVNDMEKERFALDLAIAEAKASMSDEDRKKYDSMREATMKIETEKLEADESAKDAVYKKLRGKQMAKVAAKTATSGLLTLLVGQELTAAISQAKYGLVDHLLHLKNNADADQTLLAGLLGWKPSTGDVIAQQAAQTLVQQNVELNDSQVRWYQEHPDQYSLSSHKEITFEETTTNNPVSEVAKKLGIKVHRADWGSNGTRVFDGNELRAYYTEGHDGIVTGMFGDSGTWHSGNINFENAVNAGKIKAYITLGEGTSDTPIEVVGKVVNGQLEFIPEPGSAAAACFKDGKFIGKFFEVAYDNGMNGDTQEIIPLATLVGKGLSGNVPVTESTMIEKTIYNVTKTSVTNAIENVINDGFVMKSPFVAFSDRNNLTYKEKADNSPAPAPAPGSENQPAEIPQGNQGLQPPATSEQNGPDAGEIQDNTGNEEQNNPDEQGENNPENQASSETNQEQNNSEDQTSGEAFSEEDEDLADEIFEGMAVLEHDKDTIDQISEILDTYPTHKAHKAVEHWLKMSAIDKKELYELFDKITNNAAKIGARFKKWDEQERANRSKFQGGYDHIDLYKYWFYHNFMKPKEEEEEGENGES